MWSGQEKTLRPSQIKATFGYSMLLDYVTRSLTTHIAAAKFTSFQGIGQHDAQEFMSFLLGV